MKQSTKLLSIVLALVMCFGCFSVVGNAALVKSEVQYDSIDNAKLSAEQVADIALDLVDQLLIDADILLDITVLKIDLRGLDTAADSLYSASSGFLWAIAKGLLGDAGDLNFSALKNLKRSNGDIDFAMGLLKFLNDNKNIVKKAVYGIGTSNGLSLGGIVNGLLDLDDINQYLGNNLKPMVLGLVFDALMYGSYGMNSKWDDLASKPYSSLDVMANDALYRLLTVPQDYTWEGEGDDAVKVWNMDSIVSKQFKDLDAATAKAMINVNNNSLLSILDNILQIAMEEFGLPAINSALKKVLMDAMGVDFVEITDEVPAEVMDAFNAVDPSTYINYLVKDYFFNVDGTYYYCDMRTRTVTDANGNPVVDEETGKELKEEVRKFYKAVAGTGNDMYDLVNWDYEFTVDSLVNEEGDTVTTQQLTAEYGSIFGCLNHLLYIILKEAINPDVVDVDDIFMDGGNDMLNENIGNVARWAVVQYAKDIFGKSSPYVDEEGFATAEFEDMIYDEENDIIDLIAYIGLPFFEDAMPQLIMPKNADGTFDFGTEDQVLKFGAIVIREFITDITPAVNYDNYIFQSGTLTSATGRKFASHTQDEWVNIILNMGLDIAYTYLSGITNFVGTIPAIGITRDRWLGMLDAIVTWGANYIGSGASSTLAGFEPNTFNTLNGGNPDVFDKLDYALNTLLPLGFISNCSGNGYAFSFEALIDKIIAFATDFDVAGVLSLIGRGADGYYNFLKDKNVLTAVLDLVNQILALVFGSNMLPNTANADTVLDLGNLQTTVVNLLGGLYTRGNAIFNGALPVVAQFIEDWGGEQKIGTPEISFAATYNCSNGALGTTAVTVSNGSKGVWRGYYDKAGVQHQDNQYAYKLTNVKAYNVDGSASSYVTIGSYTNTKIDFGQTGTINISAANVPAAGVLARIVASYVVYDEDGAEMADGANFTVEKYIFLSYNGTDASQEQLCTDKRDMKPYIYSPFYVGYQNAASTLPSVNTYRLKNSYGVELGGDRVGSFVVQGTATQKGITLNSWGGTSKGSSITVKGDSSEYKAGFTVNQATVDAQTWTSGETLTWSVKGYGFANIGSGSDNGTKNIIVHFYDAENLSNLKSLFEKEADKIRLATGYNTTGTVAAKTLIDATPNEDTGLVETAFTATTTDEEGETVTLIDRAQAWTNYVNAFVAAARGARQVWNGNSVYNFAELYKNLYTASKDVEYCKMTAAEAAAAAGIVNIDADVLELEALAKNFSDAMGGKGYTDYRPYRWDRYTEARNDANNIVNRYYAALPAVPDDQFFTYTDISETDLRELVAGNQYSAYILALLENYDADQMKAREVALEKAKESYTGVKLIDVEQAENLLTRNYDRLLAVTTGNAEKKYIDAEIASAKAIYTDGSVYTERSWTRYENALAAAEAAAAGDANVEQFNAKYELQCAVNALKTEEEEASYEELEALIAQAQAVLANAASYQNDAKDFGKVLAALGMDALTNAKGNEVQLFPNAALRVNENSYDIDDQRKVDNAANALRAALAKMKFKSVVVNNAGTDVVGKDDKENDIVVSTSHIKPLKTAQAVMDFFKVTAEGLTDSTTVVSVNGTYALDNFDESAVLTGTGSTITFYKTVGSVKVPVATVTIVVDGDINGDGAVDVLDLITVELTTNAHASLSGIYKVAANVDKANEEINADDYSAITNIALADYSESEVA